MRALVTGLNGTVAPVLARTLADAGHAVIPWDRARVPTDDDGAIRDFIRHEHPDACFHVATGSPDWAEAIARVCAQEQVAFLFTSSVSVFGDTQRGPFSVDSLPQPEDDYGRYKLDCERRVRAAHPEARVARLGWQIGTVPGGNHMVDYLDRTFRAHGPVAASAGWYPACSFLDDTAAALLYIMEMLPPGLYHLDGNPGLSFYDIAMGLNRLLGEPWQITRAGHPVRNNLLRDPRVSVRPITLRLPAPPVS